MRILFEVLILSGLGLFVFGVFLLSEPVGIMAGGAFLAAYGIFGAIAWARTQKPKRGGES